MKELDTLRREVAELMPRRAAHVLGCEETAAALAARWGAPVQKARYAALLHDITKYYSQNDQLKTAKKYGIITGNDFDRFPAVVHSFTGAEVAKYEYGADEEIADAIRWHTTGKAGMSLLAKIICLADYIEPTRSFPGLDEVRRIAFVDLDEALVCSFVGCMTYNMEKRATLHPSTLDAYNYILEQRREK